MALYFGLLLETWFMKKVFGRTAEMGSDQFFATQLRIGSFVDSYRRRVHGWLFAIVQGRSPGLDVLNGPVPSLWRRKSNVGPM